MTLVGSLFALRQWAKDSTDRQDRREKAEDERHGELVRSIKAIGDEISKIAGRTTQTEERLSSMSRLHDERHAVIAIALDELKGDTKRHNKEINDFARWQSRVDERMKLRQREED